MSEPTTRADVEALLRQKYEDGEADSGLFDTGLCYVVMDNVDGELMFTWFDHMREVNDLIGV